jgi:hypothetical protein
VLLSVQIPIVDVRPLLRADTGRDELPMFPRPERVFARASARHHQSSFVSGVGPVRPRLSGGAGPWPSESYYVDVTSLIRIKTIKPKPDPPALAPGDVIVGNLDRLDGTRAPRPVYRNFHTDGIVGRLEIGFSYRPYRRSRRFSSSVSDEEMLDAPTHLKGSRREVPLVELGPTFAAHLLSSTSSHDRVESWWVQAGPPATVTERPSDEAPTYVPDSAGQLDYEWNRHHGTRVLKWHINHGTASADEIRRLRIHVSRLHTDFSAFGVVLALCQAEALDPQHPPLERYLIRTAGLLTQSKRHGFYQAGLLATALAPMQEVYSGVLESLTYLRESTWNPELTRRLDRLQGALGSSSGAFLIRDLVINVTKNETNISGGTIGAVSTGSGDAHGAVNTGSGNASVHSGPDVSELIDTLTRHVAGLRDHLPDEDAAVAEDTADGVKRELSLPPEERDQAKLTSRFTRLLALASHAGAAGTAVAQAIEALRAALGMG